jgi:hypothetical protein
VLFYNCLGDTHRMGSPQYARNWSIGCRRQRSRLTASSTRTASSSTRGVRYLRQLQGRLGTAALADIGY